VSDRTPDGEAGSESRSLFGGYLRSFFSPDKTRAWQRIEIASQRGKRTDVPNANSRAALPLLPRDEILVKQSWPRSLGGSPVGTRYGGLTAFDFFSRARSFGVRLRKWIADDCHQKRTCYDWGILPRNTSKHCANKKSSSSRIS